MRVRRQPLLDVINAADVASGSAAAVRDREMQPFIFELSGIGICDP